MCGKHYIKNNKNQGDMSFETFSKLAPLLKQALVVKLFGGGKPLFRKDFLKILEITSHYKPFIEFSTSAFLLNKETARKIIEYNVGLIIFSISGATQKTYEKIHKGSDFERVKNNIKYLNKFKTKENKRFPKLEIYFVLMKENFNELPALVNLAHYLGIEHITIKEMIVINPNMEVSPKKNITSKDLKIIKETIVLAEKYNISLNWECSFNKKILEVPGMNKSKDIIAYDRDEIKSCYLPWCFALVSIDGMISPCCLSFGKLLFGNIKTEKIKKIWNGKKWINLRKKIADCKYDGICYECVKKNLYPVHDPDYSIINDYYISLFIKESEF